MIATFLLGFSSLFPLINPIGTAIIINPYFEGQSKADHRNAALVIALSTFFLGVGALVLGSAVLKFMGVSLPTTQIGGGLLIAKMGLEMMSPDQKAPTTDSNAGIQHALFYPLTFPLTLGPGGISTLITLSAHSHSQSLSDVWMSHAAVAAALFVVCVITFFCYVYSKNLIRRIGTSGSLVLNRLSAFLVFCIGIQMFLSGLEHFFPQLLHGAG